MASSIRASSHFPHQVVCDALQRDADTCTSLKLKSAHKNGLTIYNYTGASPHNEITNLCRGLILDDQYNIIAACMPRFFNVSETSAVIDPTIKYPTLEKLDGTYIQVYRYKGKFYISTKGTVEGANMVDGTLFEDRVFKALGFQNAESFQMYFNALFDTLHLHTLWFEYTSPDNRIVTLYQEDRVSLLGGYTTDGIELGDAQKECVVEKIRLMGCRIDQPKLTRSSLEELDKIFLASNEEEDGMLLEGFTIVVDKVRYKYKNPKWVLAHISSHNLTFEKILYNVLFRSGDVKELLVMIPSMVETYQPMIDAIEYLNKLIHELWKECHGKQDREKFTIASRATGGATLFEWYMYDTIPPRDFADDIMRNEVASMKRRIGILQKLDLIPKKVSPARIPEEWSEFGCRDSTDVDIIIFVRKPEHLYANYEASYFQEHYPGREVDINVALIRESNNKWYIKQTTKGTAVQTHNIVFSTARSPTPLSCLVELNTRDMVRGVATHILRFMEDLVPKDVYLSERVNRKRAFCGDKTSYAIQILKRIRPLDTPAWRSEIKAIVMKLLQVLLYHHDRTEVYQKAELAKVSSEKLNIPEDSLLWYLYRGNRGNIDETILCKLADLYQEVVREVDVEPDWQVFPLVMNNKTRLDPLLFDMFMANPIDCTPQFATRFHLVHGEKLDSIQQVFYPENSPIEIVPEPLRPLVVDISQGGDEWKNLQRKYNGQSVDTTLPSEHQLGYAAQYYNLIRGHMVEALASQSIQQDGYYPLHVGMLVDHKTEEAISPDLMLVSEDNIDKLIVYEIKCVYGAKNSSSYHRAVWMASRQLKRAVKMIQRTGLSATARLIIVYASYSGFTAELAEISV